MNDEGTASVEHIESVAPRDIPAIAELESPSGPPATDSDMPSAAPQELDDTSSPPAAAHEMADTSPPPYASQTQLSDDLDQPPTEPASAIDGLHPLERFKPATKWMEPYEQAAEGATAGPSSSQAPLVVFRQEAPRPEPEPYPNEFIIERPFLLEQPIPVRQPRNGFHRHLDPFNTGPSRRLTNTPESEVVARDAAQTPSQENLVYDSSNASDSDEALTFDTRTALRVTNPSQSEESPADGDHTAEEDEHEDDEESLEDTQTSHATQFNRRDNDGPDGDAAGPSGNTDSNHGDDAGQGTSRRDSAGSNEHHDGHDRAEEDYNQNRGNDYDSQADNDPNEAVYHSARRNSFSCPCSAPSSASTDGSVTRRDGLSDGNQHHSFQTSFSTVSDASLFAIPLKRREMVHHPRPLTPTPYSVQQSRVRQRSSRGMSGQTLTTLDRDNRFYRTVTAVRGGSKPTHSTLRRPSRYRPCPDRDRLDHAREVAEPLFDNRFGRTAQSEQVRQHFDRQCLDYVHARQMALDLWDEEAKKAKQTQQKRQQQKAPRTEHIRARSPSFEIAVEAQSKKTVDWIARSNRQFDKEVEKYNRNPFKKMKSKVSL